METTMRLYVSTFLIAAALVTSAQAEDLKGKISFESKAGCEGLKTGISIKTNGDTAEIFVGTSSDGTIKIDPASGKFLAKQTSLKLTVSGSVKDGTLMRREKKVKGGCTGQFTVS
jgi:hypothetical protein